MKADLHGGLMVSVGAMLKGFAVVALLSGSFCSQAQITDAALATPCLQNLKAQEVRKPTSPKKQNARTFVGAGLGGLFGAVVGGAVCPAGDTACRVDFVAAGGTLGAVLGKKLDKQAERKLAEASYAAALSGETAALTLEQNRCALVEPLTKMNFEKREVQIAVAPGVVPPAGGLRTMAEFNVPSGKVSVPLSDRPAPSARNAPLRVQPGQQMFVMGSVDGGKYLLVADTTDLGYVARGYAPMVGWQRVSMPENQQPQLGALPQAPESATLVAEVPCWTERQVFRSEEGKKSKQEARDVRQCRYPDGSTSPDISDS